MHLVRRVRVARHEADGLALADRLAACRANGVSVLVHALPLLLAGLGRRLPLAAAAALRVVLPCGRAAPWAAQLI